jgi:hypothetical protein
LCCGEESVFWCGRFHRRAIEGLRTRKDSLPRGHGAVENGNAIPYVPLWCSHPSPMCG